MIYHAKRNHPELRCPKCGCAWFHITGFARVTLHYDGATRAFLDLVDVDEDSRLSISDVVCMDCEYDCTALVGDTFGPRFEPPRVLTDCDTI
jgi:hypothetical protein